jgi:hypothetical protein
MDVFKNNLKDPNNKFNVLNTQEFIETELVLTFFLRVILLNFIFSQHSK